MKLKRNLAIASIAILLSIFATDQASSYQSQSTLPEWANNATIYEVNIRQYTESGTFKDFSSELPRLKKLGVKILWLMPIQPISEKNRKGVLGSPYSISDYKGINSEFGTAADFRLLMEQAHQLGFKVVLDWVANHSGWDNPWIVNKSWYHQDAEGNVISPNADWSDVAWLNYANLDMRKAMIDAMSFWVKDFDIDGFRADVASGVPNNFWEEANSKLQKIKPLFMLAEAQNTYGLLDKAFVADYNWDLMNQFKYIATGDYTQSELAAFCNNQKSQYPTKAFPMNFITNHDENSWNGSEFRRYGKAVKGLAALSFIYPGIPLIYSGQEIGNTRELAFFEKDFIPNLHTSNVYTDLYRNLITLKANNKSLWLSAPFRLDSIKTNNSKVISVYRSFGSNRVLFILNVSDQSQKVTLELGKNSDNYFQFSTGKAKKLGKTINSTMNAWGFEIYSTSPSR